jgi:hypothetical protein
MIFHHSPSLPDWLQKLELGVAALAAIGALWLININAVAI